MVQSKQKPLQSSVVGIAASIVFLILIGLIIFAVRSIDYGPTRKRQVQTVHLMRDDPPPQPKPVEKPPEPVIEQPQEVIEQPPETPPPDQTAEDQSQNDQTARDNLGVDAEGGAGADGFGLVGKKGGRPLLIGGDGSSGGGCSPLRKYAWYTRKIEMEIKKRLMFQGNNLPSDDLHVLVKITLDEQGSITDYSIYDSSGNDRLDEAVELAMKQTQSVSEPPPEGMPRTVKLRISLG
ncbi:MAG: TonB family protein [bacterium]